jgi:alcohol dehydrogenase class IV
MSQGTGSETTGTAILDIPSKSFKTGIASRALKPTLGIVDLNNTATCPREVAIAAGLDVLFHSLESESVVLCHTWTYHLGLRLSFRLDRCAVQRAYPASRQPDQSP